MRAPQGTEKQQISIHAPPRGATRTARSGSTSSSFQFTPLREGRHERVRVTEYHYEISIHAPPRGATWGKKCGWSSTSPFQFTPLREGRQSSRFPRRKEGIFQFTPLREGRHACDPRYTTITRFQFTPLREGRPPEAVEATPADNFNSRPSARGDKKDQKNLEKALFQFTPLREGRRRRRQWKPLRQTISIHAPPRGATCRFACCFLAFCISIHAPPRGATNIRHAGQRH